MKPYIMKPHDTPLENITLKIKKNFPKVSY